jgi:hypothetical protein
MSCATCGEIATMASVRRPSQRSTARKTRVLGDPK